MPARHAASRQFSKRSWHRALLGASAAGLVLIGALLLRWLHATATQDLVSFLEQAPPCSVAWRDARAGDSTRTVHLTLSDASGSVEATLRLPPGDAACAAVVILGGLRTGRHATDLVDGDLPYAVAALDYARSDPRRIEGIRWLTELPELIRDFKRTGVALRDLQRAVASHERVDATRVYLLGASLGTPLACAVAAVVEPAGLALLYGFADHGSMFAHRLEPHVRWHPARKLLAAFAGWLSGAFDPVRTLPRACGTPILCIGSAEDEDLPPHCSQALWESACEPKQRIDLPGGHIDAGRKQAILRAAAQAVRDWLENTPSASVGRPLQGDSACASS